MVIRELTESDLQPPTRSAGNRCKIDRFPILNVGECDVHSDPKHGQEGLFVQKLGNISGGGHFKEKQASLASQKIIVDDGGGDFQASFPDIFAQYQNTPPPPPPLTGDIAMANKDWNSWKTTPFDCWQCQLNFAVLCATAGCGVSVEDHLQATDPLLASLYRFHVYFTTRRIFEELRVALPGEKSHSWYLNTFDARAHKRLCSEFVMSPGTDWRQKLDHGCLRPRILGLVLGAVGHLPACALLRWPLLPPEGRHTP